MNRKLTPSQPDDEASFALEPYAHRELLRQTSLSFNLFNLYQAISLMLGLVSFFYFVFGTAENLKFSALIGAPGAYFYKLATEAKKDAQQKLRLLMNEANEESGESPDPQDSETD